MIAEFIQSRVRSLKSLSKMKEWAITNEGF
jgi:hypothetical protein